ncbi:hypothetical protein CH296_05165 [Rhodococcus sp. 14-2496-1d]|uniref:hypothetical protein n=1 Tax=Rhodococcus sp. 14-2496-1d TaxID=2023146 RepID=UPI000B9B8C40|nr:hypothetical protein [Rhodococcus sp. 14-2496-1d]OZF36965.1 hypothetical protein CH296_05165 [Rhodococcus sp. 14-2496-1d]
MIRRLVLIAVTAALVALFGSSAVALAQPSAVPAPAPGAVTAQQPASRLPAHFPDDLKKFIGGTEEFRSGPWFTGNCADHGGDLGTYISQALTNENRLLYWTASDENKAAMLGGASAVGSDPQAQATATAEITRQAVADGTEPPADALPTVFPAGDTSFHPPTGTCAEDLARWGNKEWGTWGFAWAQSPDADSLTAIKALPGADKVPDAAWSDPCSQGSGDQYCMHAFFVDCSKAERADASRCQDWNLSIGRLFAGTANWIDKNTSFTERLEDTLGKVIAATPQYKLGKAYLQAFSWISGAANDVVDFVTDPTTVIDDWVNATKSGALSLTDAVLRGLTSTGDFDPTQQWFVTYYAGSTGLGIMVMSLAVLLAIMRSRHKGSPSELVANVFGYMPAGVVMMLFSLALAQLLIEFATVLTEGIASFSGSTITEMVENIYATMGTLNKDTVVGGSIVGLVFFGILLLGAMSVYLGLLMHQIGLPLTACVAGIGYGMWVHPTWRTKALRPLFTFVGIVLSKPMLFLLIAIVLAGANNALLSGSGGSGDLTSLGALVLVGASMVVVGLAPWAMLKWAPILPTKADSEGFGGGGGSVAGGVIGGVGSSALFRSRSGGGGGGGSTVTPRSTRSGDGVDKATRSAHSAPANNSTPGHTTAAAHSGADKGGASTPKRSTMGMAGRLGGKLATGSAATVASAGAAAVPIAAQSAAAAMNKAKSSAESAPSEAEGR